MATNLRQPLVGERLRALRERLFMTRAELAVATGVSPSAIVRLETGSDVRLSNYLPIVAYFTAHEHVGASLLAERILLLSPERRAALLTALGVEHG